MKINNDMTIVITEEEVKQLIREKLESEGYNVTEVNLNIQTTKWTEGFGMSEMPYEESFLRDVTISVTKK